MMAKSLFERMHDAIVGDAFTAARKVNGNPRELMMLPTDWKPDLMPERAMVEIKYDGFHAGYTRSKRAFTREGVPVECAPLAGLRALDDMLYRLFDVPHALFGEYVHVDGLEAAIGDLRRGHGTGAIMLFDAVPLDAYEGRAVSPPLDTRKIRLQRAYDRLPLNVTEELGICQSTIFVGSARDNIEIVAGEMWELGHEGIVVKDADSPYVRARSPHWQRIKRVHSVDLPIAYVDTFGGKLRALVVLYGATEVRVGVGFSDAQRASPADFRTGRMVEIKHLGATQSGSLRSPSFLRFRDDKKGA